MGTRDSQLYGTVGVDLIYKKNGKARGRGGGRGIP